MNIVPTFDASVGAIPQWYRDAVAYVINLFNTSFATNIEIDITFAFTAFSGDRGISRSFPQASRWNYATVYVQFQNTSPNSNIAAGRLPAPPQDPTSGGTFSLTTALQKVYGINSHTGSDGRVELSSSVSWSTNFTSPPGPGLFHTASAIAHEISEIMGRVGHCGAISPDNLHIFGPMDLFRFTGPGMLKPDGGPARYSLDGQNLLLSFNDPSVSPKKDPADWDLFQDCFGGFNAGERNAFSRTDYTAMTGIGYTGVANNAPIFAI